MLDGLTENLASSFLLKALIEVFLRFVFVIFLVYNKKSICYLSANEPVKHIRSLL